MVDRAVARAATGRADHPVAPFPATAAEHTAAPSGEADASPAESATSPLAVFGEAHFAGPAGTAGELVPAPGRGWGSGGASSTAASAAGTTAAPPAPASAAASGPAAPPGTGAGGARPVVLAALSGANGLPAALPAEVRAALAEAADSVAFALAAGPLGDVIAPGAAGRPAAPQPGEPSAETPEATEAPGATDTAASRSEQGGEAAPGGGATAARSGPAGAATGPQAAGAAVDLVSLAAHAGPLGQAPGLLPPIGRVPVDEQRNSGGRELEPGPGALVEVLPLGAGLACLGLGLGMVGLRLRRD
ncbi:hypothetical protein [Streptomyces bohaiensis]|uniref:hypothetical protein n=2 Tax=Streptomyces bohaiensis TaxID=1431344 RepID=UPI0030C6D465